MAWIKSWLPVFLRTGLFMVVWKGILHYLSERHIHPDVWVADLLEVATTPDNLNWISWGIVAVGAVLLSTLWETGVTRWLTTLFNTQGPTSESAVATGGRDGLVHLEGYSQTGRAAMPASGTVVEAQINSALSASVGQTRTAPGAPILVGPDRKPWLHCQRFELRNYSDGPIFNGRLTFKATFKKIQKLNNNISSETGEIAGECKFDIFIQRLDPCAEAFTFYVTNISDYMIDLQYPTSLTQKDPPADPLRVVSGYPPFANLWPPDLEADQAAYVSLHEAAIRGYETSRRAKGMHSGMADTMAEGDVNDVKTWFCWSLWEHINLYGVHPPSRDVEKIDRALRNQYQFEFRGGELVLKERGGHSMFTELKVLSTELREALTRIKEFRLEK